MGGALIIMRADVVSPLSSVSRPKPGLVRYYFLLSIGAWYGHEIRNTSISCGIEDFLEIPLLDLGVMLRSRVLLLYVCAGTCNPRFS